MCTFWGGWVSTGRCVHFVEELNIGNLQPLPYQRSMNHPPYAKRRFWLLVIMTLLGGVAGFLWGQQVGIRQGKAAMLKILESRLNQPPPKALMPL